MGHYDYMCSQQLDSKDYPFYALIMAAMRKADSVNARLLRDAFPLVWQELEERYHLPGGLYPGEVTEEQLAAAREAAVRSTRLTLIPEADGDD